MELSENANAAQLAPDIKINGELRREKPAGPTRPRQWRSNEYDSYCGRERLPIVVRCVTALPSLVVSSRAPGGTSSDHLFSTVVEDLLFLF